MAIKGSHLKFVVILSTVLLVLAVAVLTTIYVGELSAQTPAPAPRHGTRPAPAPQSPPEEKPAPGAPAAPAPVRTETIPYGSWTVNCSEAADGRGKKVCSATMPIALQQQNRIVKVGAWIMAHNNEGALLSLLQTPQIDVGVLIPRGVDLKLGDGKPHKLNYVDCNPQRCEATLMMDEAFIRELTANAEKSAAVTFWKTDGAEFTINFQSIKGVDKALAALR